MKTPSRLPRWLFQHSRPEIEKIPNWWEHFEQWHGRHADWHSTYWPCISKDLEKHAEMCVPDLPSRLTAHLTRAIELPTMVLRVLDEYGPTESWGYDDPTIRMEVSATDRYATQPIPLEEIMQLK